MSEETEKNIQWFVSTFKAANLSACEKIECFMGDKDGFARKVIKDLFKISMYIFTFHYFKISNRQIFFQNMQINLGERDFCRRMIKKWLSEREYDHYYRRFDQNAPYDPRKYFEHHWKDIKEEWCTYYMTNGNFNVQTNNKLELLHQKLKSATGTLLSLIEFGQKFFPFHDAL